jgi:hypothetical protein
LVGCPLCCCSPLAGLKGGVDQPRVLKIVFGLAVGLCLRYTTYYHLVPRVLLPLFPYCPSSGLWRPNNKEWGKYPCHRRIWRYPSRLDARLSRRFYKVITIMPPSFFCPTGLVPKPVSLLPKHSSYPRDMLLQKMTYKLKLGALWMLGTFLSISFAFRQLVLFTVTFQPELSRSATSDFRGVEMIFHSICKSKTQFNRIDSNPGGPSHLTVDANLMVTC